MRAVRLLLWVFSRKENVSAFDVSTRVSPALFVLCCFLLLLVLLLVLLLSVC